MNVYIKVKNLKRHMFRPLLGHHQVLVSVKVLKLYPIWLHIMDCLYTIQYHTCNKKLRHSELCITCKAIGLRLDESLCIQIDAKLKLKLKIIKAKMAIP
jgi:hypothetical protein